MEAAAGRPVPCVSPTEQTGLLGLRLPTPEQPGAVHRNIRLRRSSHNATCLRPLKVSRAVAMNQMSNSVVILNLGKLLDTRSLIPQGTTEIIV